MYTLRMNIFNKIAYWTKDNALILFFAFIVGLLSVLPHILAWHALGNSYHGIPFLYSANEDYYMARIHEITDGHLMVGSPNFYEYKQSFPLVPPIGEYFYIILSFILHTSLPSTLVIAKFIFPAVLFLLVYRFVRLLSQNEDSTNGTIWGGIAAGLLITLGSGLVDYNSILKHLAHGGSALALSPWVRSVNPITGALLLFTFLPLVWKTIKKDEWKYPIVAGLLLALSCGYIFSFALGFTIIGVLSIFALYHKEYATLLRLVTIGALGVFLDALYWINILPYLAAGGGDAQRSGMLYMHTPLLNKFILLSLLVFLTMILYARLHKKISFVSEYKKYDAVWFVFATSIAGLIVLNQQVLTGRTIWPYHFVQYTVPLSIVMLFVSFYLVLKPYFPRLWISIVSISIITSLALGIWNSSTYVFQMKSFATAQEYAPAYVWLETHTKKDSVVLVSDDWNEYFTNLLPAFTHNNVYLTGNITNIVPVARIEHNFFVKLRLLDITDEMIYSYLLENPMTVNSYFAKDWHELLSTTRSSQMTEMLPGLARRYRDFLKKDFATELKLYRIDYIASQGDLNPIAKRDLGQHIFPVFSSGLTTIYQFQ